MTYYIPTAYTGLTRGSWYNPLCHACHEEAVLAYTTRCPRCDTRVHHACTKPIHMYSVLYVCDACRTEEI